MNNWEFLWIIIQRDLEIKSGGLLSLPSSGFSDWYVELPDKKKVQGKTQITEYINQLGAQGWEQVSSTGEQWAEATWMKAIHLFFKRQKL